jgi:uncharacterized protein YxeA
MSDKFKSVLIGVLGISIVILIGVVMYQRVVMDAQRHLIIEMYQYIVTGCQISQLH